MNDDFWVLIEEAIENDDPVDNIIPLDLTGLCKSDFLKVLSIEATYGKDQNRKQICRKKLIDIEGWRNCI